MEERLVRMVESKLINQSINQSIMEISLVQKTHLALTLILWRLSKYHMHGAIIQLYYPIVLLSQRAFSRAQIYRNKTQVTRTTKIRLSVKTPNKNRLARDTQILQGFFLQDLQDLAISLASLKSCLTVFSCKILARFFISCKKSFIFSARLARYVQDLMQDLARVAYFLQDGFYWEVTADSVSGQLQKYFGTTNIATAISIVGGKFA